MILPWSDHSIPNEALYEKESIVFYAGNGNPRQSLMIRRPREGKRLPLLLWLHGGGLTTEAREIPAEFYDGKRIVVEARYRLAQEASPDEIVSDAARALIWCREHAEQIGSDPRLFFYGGMSAGCYLAALTAFDPKRVRRCGGAMPHFAGLLLLSGQYSTHFKVKEILHPEHPNLRPLVDDDAPMNFLAPDLPPMMLVSGEPGLDMPARPEENAYVAASLKAMGHPDAEYVRLAGCDHAGCLDHGGAPLLRFMERIAGAKGTF